MKMGLEKLCENCMLGVLIFENRIIIIQYIVRNAEAPCLAPTSISQSLTEGALCLPKRLAYDSRG
jgi:hypothetical protein